MMAGTIPAVVDENLLKCGLCSSPLKDTRLLPCLHAFCQNCLVKYTRKQKHRQSQSLDLKIVEDAVKGGLDREIPVHGYEDVIGLDPNPWGANISSSSDIFGSCHGYSQVPDEHGDEKKHEYHEIPQNTLDKQLLAVDKQKKKSLPKNVLGEIDENSITMEMKKEIDELPEAPVPGYETTPVSYLPMNRGNRSNSEPTSMNFEIKLDVKPQSLSARTSQVPGFMNNSVEGISFNPLEQPDESSKVPNSVVAYELMSPPSENPYMLNNLTGFGIAAPFPVASMKKIEKPVKINTKEPVYELEKPVKKSPSSKKKFGKLSKKSSKSVSILSFPVKKLLMKNSSNDSLHKITTSKSFDDSSPKLLSHSVSKPENLNDSNASEMTHATSSPYLLEEDLSFTESVMSNLPSSFSEKFSSSEISAKSTMKSNNFRVKGSDSDGEDLDGYVMPVNKRKPPNITPEAITHLEQQLPVLPTKTTEKIYKKDKIKENNDSKKINDIPQKMPRRKKLSAENLKSTIEVKNSRESICDCIYEEIQCGDENPAESKHNEDSSGVPMMTAISSKPKSPPKMQPIQVRAVKPNAYKVKNIVSKTSEVKHSSPHNIENKQQTTALKLGGKLARKSQMLLDGNGFSYITDSFEKVQIEHDEEEFELVYEEVHDIEDVIDESSENEEFPCPLCETMFTLTNEDIDSVQKCKFLENLKETRRIENELQPSCRNCKTKAAWKCLDCDCFLCTKCHDTHNWSKVVKGHKVMSLTQLQSGMYTNQIMTKKQLVCPQHSGIQPTYFCDTCNLAICKECSHCYHNLHKCQLIDDISIRSVNYLQAIPMKTQHLINKFQVENMQIEKYLVQNMAAKKKLVADVTERYMKARELLDSAFSELQRHIEIRYNEETGYLNHVKSSNDRFLERVGQTHKLAEHVTEYGSPADVIEMTKQITSNLLAMESCEPVKIDYKMEMNFTPLSSVTPLDVLPLIGQVTRMHQPISRLDIMENNMANDSNPIREIVKLKHCFSSKSPTDKKGCKPTGIALTKDDNIVLVDDINKKIKIFTEAGDLVQEIVPKSQNELVDPWDITVTNYGNFAVTDRGSRQVKIFDPDGDLVCHFGPHLANPWGICCNNDGDLIVTDTDNKCVFIHDSNGNMKYKIDPPEKMAKFPEYVTTNSYNDIIVSDLKAHCIYVFNLIGQFLFRIGPKSPANSKVKVLSSPCGVYCDAQDNILVTDYDLMRVTKFDKNGNFLSHFLTFMDQLRAPQSLIVNCQDHTVLLDGTSIKTFIVEEVIDESKEPLDLELKPKRYNRGQKLTSKNEHNVNTVSDGEEDRPEFDRMQPVRKTLQNMPSPKSQRQNVRSRMTRTPASNRSASVPRPHAKDLLKTYDVPTPFRASKPMQTYDIPISQVSVKLIKEKLAESRECSPEKQLSGELWENQKEVSVDKVRETLFKQTGTKPKIQPKPKFNFDSKIEKVEKHPKSEVSGAVSSKELLLDSKVISPKPRATANAYQRIPLTKPKSLNQTSLSVVKPKERSVSPRSSSCSSRESKSPDISRSTQSSRSSSKEVKRSPSSSPRDCKSPVNSRSTQKTRSISKEVKRSPKSSSDSSRDCTSPDGSRSIQYARSTSKEDKMRTKDTSKSKTNSKSSSDKVKKSQPSDVMASRTDVLRKPKPDQTKVADGRKSPSPATTKVKRSSHVSAAEKPVKLKKNLEKTVKKSISQDSQDSNGLDTVIVAEVADPDGWNMDC